MEENKDDTVADVSQVYTNKKFNEFEKKPYKLKHEFQSEARHSARINKEKLDSHFWVLTTHLAFYFV